jgi:hypothetical protein
MAWPQKPILKKTYSIQMKISLPSLFIITILLAFCGTSMAKGPDVAAWIESANPHDALTPKNSQSRAKIIIFRQGKPLALKRPAMMTELLSGDRILINDSKASLTLLTSTGRLSVTAEMSKREGYEVIASPNSIWSNLVALVTDQITLGQTQVISASSRGVPWLNAEGAPTIPADQTQFSKLAAGERELHFRWQGGTPPYRLSLIRDEQVLSEINVTKGSEASLPRLAWPPGDYTLVITDKRGLASDGHARGSVTANLILFDPADIPPMPSALANSPLPEDARQLLYADWLARQGEGEWSMEAIQQAFPYAKSYSPVGNWLRQWGGE